MKVLRRYASEIYIIMGILVLVLSLMFLLWSISYMERAMVASSLISILIGFTLLSAALYLLRLSAYVYATGKE